MFPPLQPHKKKVYKMNRFIRISHETSFIYNLSINIFYLTQGENHLNYVNKTNSMQFSLVWTQQ